MAYDNDLAWDKMGMLISEQLPVKDKWQQFIDFHTEQEPGTFWETLRDLNVEKDSEEVQKWLEDMATNDPLHEQVSALWLGIIHMHSEELQRTYFALYCMGYDQYSPYDLEWALRPSYAPENRFFTPVVMNELIPAIAEEDCETQTYLNWILPLAYSCFLLDDIIKNSLNKEAFLEHKEILNVVCGYDNGDYGEISPIQTTI